jgi:hypothetical protein
MSNAQNDPAVLGPVQRQVRPVSGARPLVERLRDAALPGTNRHALDNEAADEIERLRAALKLVTAAVPNCVMSYRTHDSRRAMLVALETAEVALGHNA